MLKKYLYLITIFSIFFTQNILAKAINDKTVQIVATNIESKDGIIKASGDVLIFSPKYYITANKLVYDKNSSTVELFGNVNISKNGEMISLSQYAFIDMKKDIDKATPILLVDKKSKIWVNSKTLTKNKDLNILNDALISSCECSNPAWSIGFSSGDFNTTDQWINTYNAVLYINDIPVFYTPYFGFPTDKTRRTGLLKPTIGYGKKDGFLYAQPIYFAPQKNYDIEYIPQYRTNRGYGNELKYRYKDSQYSQLNISAGMFKEEDEYYKKENLINQEHYGWDLQYDRTKLFSKGNNSDGLSISLQDMNDVEYKNTQYKNQATYTNQLLKSRIKYFYNTDKYYSDIEVQYYNDISKSNNDDVMQILPQIQLHKYSNGIFFDKLLTSIDLKYKNRTRKEGIGAEQTDITVPFSYSRYFFSKYLDFSFVDQINFTNIKYHNEPTVDSGTIVENKYIITLGTDILKSFDTKIHTFNFTTTYTYPNVLTRYGELDGYDKYDTDTTLSLFPTTKTKKNINFSINQTLYNKDDLKAIINHKINQAIIYDDNGDRQLGDLENEITLYYEYGSLSNRLLYNHDDKMVIKSTYAFKYKKDDSFINIDYSYAKNKEVGQENLSYRDVNSTESITTNIGTKVLKYYTISYKEQYNITNKESGIKEYLLSIDKKCWRLDLKLADNLIASATTTQKARRQNIIYATITLKPIVTIKQVYVQDEREN